MKRSIIDLMNLVTNGDIQTIVRDIYINYNEWKKALKEQNNSLVVPVNIPKEPPNDHLTQNEIRKIIFHPKKKYIKDKKRKEHIEVLFERNHHKISYFLGKNGFVE